VRVTSRPANHSGDVFVLEYHRISPKEARWDRSRERFRKDLERLYRMGFRPVTAGEYLHNLMDLPPGASPVVITFDDADGSQIRFLPDGSLDPTSAAGIWKAFADKHPGFPVKGTFYVLPNAGWGQGKAFEQKARALLEMGSEIGSHTVTHANLRKLSEEGVKRELAGAIERLNALGLRSPVSIALPYGISPRNAGLLRKFSYRGKEYSMSGAMLVGANPAPAPASAKFDPYRIPRIQAIEGEAGITFWLDKVQRGEVRPYVQ
jgi:peptidoglycan/xylan/chitin deacetylase (PgdA/CDA1 family)